MAIIYIDGFDGYTTADLPTRWAAPGLGAFSGWSINATSGRYGLACLVGVPGTTAVWRALGGNYTTLIIGFAFKTSIVPVSGQFNPMLQFVGDGSPGPQLRLTVGGVIQLVTSAGTLIVNCPGTSVQANVWNQFEIMITFNTAAGVGTTVIRMNEQVVGSNTASYDSTMAGSVAYCDTVALGQISDSGAFYNGNPSNTSSWDDAFFLDTTGVVNNGFLGDMRVEAVHPTGPGTYTELTPNTGTNWAAVADTTIDDDTTYVHGNAIGLMDTYVFGALSSTPTLVKGFQLTTVMRKDDAGGRIVATQVRSGGSDFTSPKQISVGDQYAVYTDIWNSDPNGNIAWTGATINAVEAGIKIVG